MVAIIKPSPSGPCPPQPPSRPVLRLVPGGQSPAVRAATYRRRRLVAGLACVVLVALLVPVLRVGWERAATWAAPQPAPITGPAVVVEAGAGDTVWTIVRRVRPTGDIRPAVEAVIAERGSPDLQVGDRVRVPVSR